MWAELQNACQSRRALRSGFRRIDCPGWGLPSQSARCDLPARLIREKSCGPMTLFCATLEIPGPTQPIYESPIRSAPRGEVVSSSFGTDSATPRCMRRRITRSMTRRFRGRGGGNQSDSSRPRVSLSRPSTRIASAIHTPEITSTNRQSSVRTRNKNQSWVETIRTTMGRSRLATGRDRSRREPLVRMRTIVSGKTSSATNWHFSSALLALTRMPVGMDPA
jgi:hypothetical protein